MTPTMTITSDRYATALRIVIADDHALFRQGLKSLLDLHAAVTVVRETDQVGGLTAVLDSLACDILLLDLQMERSSLPDIPELAARTKVIVVTASERSEEALDAIR